MRLIRHLVSGLAWLAVLGAARADAPADPLRLVPDEADVVLEVKHPRRLVETANGLEALKELQALAPARELLDNTAYRRLYQLVAYFERELGAPWPELLDRLAGGGMVATLKIGPDPQPALLVVQGKDERLMRRFAELAQKVVEQELARQESKERVEKGRHRDIETVQVGKELRAAVVGSALLVSNSAEALKRAIDLHLDGPAWSMAGVKHLGEARALLPADPLASLWVSLRAAHESPQGKDVFKKGRDPNLTVLFGGWIDTLGRAPYLVAGLYRDADGLRAALRIPQGRQGMGPEQAVHTPPADGPGLLPLLEPRDVLLSHSFYFDAGKFWDDRTKIFTPEQVKGLEDVDKNSGRFLAGMKLSQLLTLAGARHRFVAVNQARAEYTKKPKQPVPAFAVVSELRQPAEFGKNIDTVLRGVALLTGSQAKLKLVEETYAGCAIVGYRFPEEGRLPQDEQDIRFNFSPAYATVGNQFIAASTLALCRELIDLLQKESKAVPGPKVAMRTRVYAEGGAEYLKTIEDRLLMQTILGQATTPAEAKQQVESLIALVRRLGGAELTTDYAENEFRLDARLKIR